MPNSGITSGTVDKLVLDAGMLYHGNTQQGVLGGSVTFDPGAEFRNTPFANKTNDIEGHDRIIRYNSTLTVGFKEFDATRFVTLNAGSSQGTAGSVITVTMADAGVFLASIANVRAIFRQGLTNTYFEIRFAKAFPVMGAITGDDPGEGTFAVTYQARATVASPDDCPFTFKYTTGIETV